MDNKKLGVLLLVLGISLILILISYNSKLNASSNALGCNPYQQCYKNNSLLTISNIFIGIISSVISLGGYILFFNNDDKIIEKLDNIKDNKKQLKEDEKFDILFKALSKDEQNILSIIREQEGITQSTLRIKTNYSKTKLSFILKDLENKELIKKEIAGRTNELYLNGHILSLSKHL